ncbi:hypothetical protein IEQ34_005941 [Dendrobium chrysotoxum]|uniref:NADH dehydrogenase subunit 6 n=1 Tax=Dendrobium chrysotoxum TaxID=161865 RepID=A0AAV7HCT8_DENCH|nr:hypothetical protein IEQ34_005941 [Dendrobium chrysotoxum]
MGRLSAHHLDGCGLLATTGGASSYSDWWPCLGCEVMLAHFVTSSVWAVACFLLWMVSAFLLGGCSLPLTEPGWLVSSLLSVVSTFLIVL